jgi:hypothetical protein
MQMCHPDCTADTVQYRRGSVASVIDVDRAEGLLRNVVVNGDRLSGFGAALSTHTPPRQSIDASNGRRKKKKGQTRKMLPTALRHRLYDIPYLFAAPQARATPHSLISKPASQPPKTSRLTPALPPHSTLLHKAKIKANRLPRLGALPFLSFCCCRGVEVVVEVDVEVEVAHLVGVGLRSASSFPRSALCALSSLYRLPETDNGRK